MICTILLILLMRYEKCPFECAQVAMILAIIGGFEISVELNFLFGGWYE